MEPARSIHPALRPSASGKSRTKAAHAPAWNHAHLSGRLAEMTEAGGGAALTLAFSLVLDAQRQGETVAWVTDSLSVFFPPDAAESGVDLDALAVVRVPGVRAILSAADRLTRSGAFGLVVLDLGEDPRVPLAVTSRLAGLAKRHGAAILCLVRRGRGRGPGSSSLGSMVSLRAEAGRRRVKDGRFLCELRVSKDRRHVPGWTHEETRRGPEGFH